MTCDGEKLQEALSSPLKYESGKKREMVSPVLQDASWLNSALVFPVA